VSLRRARRPLLILPGSPPHFPDPELSDRDGLVAVGGDLSASRLLAAYDAGIFPWFDEGQPPLWWSPDPRTVVDASSFHVSRSLARTLRRGGFRLSFDQAFERVMRACGEERERGTWILPDMVEAYVALHHAGHAHSFEVWVGDELVGGLYGVRRGGFFAGESMFHRATDASKVALVAAVRSLFAAGVTLLDVQFTTPHLASMGTYEISRRDYLARLATARRAVVDVSKLVLVQE
jgi:leucyl/phenylalanyl-tRNA---protein transferase